MKLVKVILHFIIIGLLTIITQTGGLIWLCNTLFFKLRKHSTTRFFKITTFMMLYLFSTVSIVPQLAKLNGRTALPIQKSGNLQPLTYFTPLLNRHYVTPTLKANLMEIANEFKKETQQLHLTYLDANFPFIDGFPLIPHLIPN